MKKLLYALALFALTLSACNIPVAQEPGISVDDQAATLVAQTLTAVAQENQVPLASPTAGENPVPLASPTLDGAPTLAPNAPTLAPNATPTAGNISVTLTAGTPNATILTVDANTNCREGPGTSYAIVIQLIPGTQYQMIGRTADNKYWVVSEIGKSTQCWVPAEFSNAFGNVNLLAVVTPSAATSAAGPLQAPRGIHYEFDCTAPPNISVLLTWPDRSNNETGFHVYRDGTLVIDLPVNTTIYTDLFVGSPTVVYSYQISAYNATGEALSEIISFSCQ